MPNVYKKEIAIGFQIINVLDYASWKFYLAFLVLFVLSVLRIVRGILTPIAGSFVVTSGFIRVPNLPILLLFDIELHVSCGLLKAFNNFSNSWPEGGGA